jgi:Lsr2
MSREVIERLLDDFDGSNDASTIQFSVDGGLYTIDLNARHENELRARLNPYIEAARRVRLSRPGSRTATAVDKDHNPAIRTWALAGSGSRSIGPVG